MCKVLEVSKSGYYNWLNKLQEAPTPLEKLQDDLRQKIIQIFHESHGTYGAVRVHKELLSLGIKVSERTVGRYMKELGLKATHKNPYIVTTDSNHNKPLFKNLVQQDFTADGPNQLWLCDLTYVWTNQDAWVYLAVVIDAYSRKIVGLSVANHMRTELILEALEMAVTHRQPGPGLIVHSDRGSQYASHLYRDALEEIGALGSMSRPGNPYDNAVVESFFATLKKEFIYRNRFETCEETQKRLGWFIEDFYNEKRRHSRLNYVSPTEYEQGVILCDEAEMDPYLRAS